MLSRVFFFLLLPALGAGAGFGWSGPWGLAGGLVLGAVLWLLMDLVRASRLLAWLRSNDTAADAPRLMGLWGEVADRARRALRTREQQVAAGEARLQAFLGAIQASPNGIILLDAQGHIEWSNQTAASHFGLDPHKDLMQLVGNLIRDPAFTAYLAAGDFSRDVIFPTRDSTPSRPRRVSVQLHPYGEGRKLLLSRDITSVEQAETMRRDFVANVSHEIRTPLTVLHGFVETLQTLPLDESERAHYLGLMSQQAQRMQALVNDLLTLSRLEGSPPPGGRDWVSLASMQAQCEQEAKGLADALRKNHRIHFAPAPPLEVSGVASELQSALSNLVTNAIRYTPAGGDIDVQWRTMPDGRAEFSVRDTGPGVAPEHLPRLTERFYRVDRSRSRETGGTGLGLAIVKHVVQRHGGELQIDSALGQGSTFRIVLPASRVRAAPAAASS